jgi:pimeloyl-ACP methyl ester carboxylesterase
MAVSEPWRPQDSRAGRFGSSRDGRLGGGSGTGGWPTMSGRFGSPNPGHRKGDAMKPVVLVHGGFVDGSGWEPVYRSLRQAGHQVSVAQHPTRSLADDAAVVGRVLDQQPEPGVLVGHSEGPQPPILPPVEGFLFLDKAKFAASFAADVSPDLAAFWADAQLPGAWKP